MSAIHTSVRVASVCSALSHGEHGTAPYLSSSLSFLVAYPLSLLVHLLVGGLELLPQLGDVELQLSVLLVEALQLALHLNAGEGTRNTGLVFPFLPHSLHTVHGGRNI